MSTKEHSHTQTQNESPRDPLQKVLISRVFKFINFVKQESEGCY